MRLFSKVCTSKARLDGKTVIITGANTGIGKETARDLYARGARVILACRNVKKANDAIQDIKNRPPSNINNKKYQDKVGELAIYCLDLSKLQSVRDCAKNLILNEAAIHILINNAAVATIPYEKTENGFEMTFQVNYLAHFLLTLLLLPKMIASSPGCRIVNVSSIIHGFFDINFDDIYTGRNYRAMKAYSQSKLASVLFTKELARRLKEADIHGINVYSLHPGIIATELSKSSSRTIMPGASVLYNFFARLLFQNKEEGAQTTIYCSVDENVGNETGLYYSRCKIATMRGKARDDQYARNLWDLSCRLLHLSQENDFVAFLNAIPLVQSEEEKDRYPLEEQDIQTYM
ncbi:retinol dehydrogenase 11-like [Pseudomyrmex gracilis]|uniref:retinol dehydrogenase 11-like n=1 Tax=Pseudomyrmex gracilis TaxID=219809 RepID=UPI000994F274|nr:retinol dehydrogenase 11-like [Pseudomyrmex gracilis]XP_020278537.1 retinol dehydrogenase 11-like [Pseudomyrmex gracilis]XP_020278538.1 retinol dehydrogenase 11-like [Pseudomyrmex gracilis]